MTPNRIMGAYRAVNELASCVFPYAVTRKVHALKKRLTEEFEVVLEAEKALVAKYKGTIAEDGSYRFDTVEIATQFHREYREFLEQEGEVDLPEINLAKHVGSVNISAAAIDALEGIVLFEEG